MGSTLSLENDTHDIIWVKLTANYKIVKLISFGAAVAIGIAAAVLSGGVLAEVATIGGGALTWGQVLGINAGVAQIANKAANNRIEANESSLREVEANENSLREGYQPKQKNFHKVMPGGEWKSDKMTLSLNKRMWLVRVHKEKHRRHTTTIRTANSSVWTGPTNGSNNNYKASDKKYFKWKIEKTFTQ